MINVESEGEIQEITCDKDIKKNDVILEIEKDVEKKLKAKLKKAVEITKKYDSDVFGIGNLFYKKYPNYFNKIDDWYSVYDNISFEYKTSINLSTRGSVEKTV